MAKTNTLYHSKCFNKFDELISYLNENMIAKEDIVTIIENDPNGRLIGNYTLVHYVNNYNI